MARTKIISKKRQLQFQKDVINCILEAGGEHEESKHYPYVIRSKRYGDFRIVLYDNEKSILFSIFGKFDDVKKADGLGGMSGKHNIHNADEEYILSEFKELIQVLLA